MRRNKLVLIPKNKTIVRPAMILNRNKRIVKPEINIFEIKKRNEEKQIENIGSVINYIKFPIINEEDIISNERMIRVGDWIWSGSLDRFRMNTLNKSNILNFSYNNTLKKGDIIVIRTNLLPEFNKFLYKLKEPIILISNYSDKTVDDSFKYIADNPKVYHWFAINCTLNHPKVSKIPLGLGASHNSFGNLNLLYKMITTKNNNPNRKILINYKIDKLRPLRNPISNCLMFQGFSNTYGLPIEKYWESIVNHEFTLSPPGCGIDCYRLWETLYLGRIPVVINNEAFKDFIDLPILFVDNYDMLFDKLKIPEEWKTKEFNWNLLRYKYWTNLIHSKKNECLGITKEYELPPLKIIENSETSELSNILEPFNLS
jgi:hypothetical protein